MPALQLLEGGQMLDQNSHVPWVHQGQIPGPMQNPNDKIVMTLPLIAFMLSLVVAK